jgi:AcrR family transcriptional regulator
VTINQRRERQKEATREGILNAALEIARIEGWGAVTVRRVAASVDYTAPIVYQCFANKEAIIDEWRDRGFARLTTTLRDAALLENDTHERLFKLSDAYVRFAYHEPELYHIMHGFYAGDIPSVKWNASAAPVCKVLDVCISTWAEAQKFVLTDPLGAVHTILALLHGLIEIEMLGRMTGGERRVSSLARRAVAELTNEWQCEH